MSKEEVKNPDEVVISLDKDKDDEKIRLVGNEQSSLESMA